MWLLTQPQLAYLKALFARAGTDIEDVHEGFSGSSVTLPSVPAAGRRLDVFMNGVLAITPTHYSVAADVVTFVEPLVNVDLVIKYTEEA